MQTTPAPQFGAEADLDDWLEGQAQQDADFDEIYAPPADSAQADRLLGVLRWLERQENEAQAVAEARHQEITEWQLGRQHSIEQRRSHIERLLEGWARHLRAISGGRDKTWNLPNGTLILRSGQPRLVIVDDENAIAIRVADRWGPAAMQVKRTVVKAVVKAGTTAGASAPLLAEAPGYTAHTVVDKATGEIIEGMALLLPDRDAFKAKPKPRDAS